MFIHLISTIAATAFVSLFTTIASSDCNSTTTTLTPIFAVLCVGILVTTVGAFFAVSVARSKKQDDAFDFAHQKEGINFSDLFKAIGRSGSFIFVSKFIKQVQNGDSIPDALHASAIFIRLDMCIASKLFSIISCFDWDQFRHIICLLDIDCLLKKFDNQFERITSGIANTQFFVYMSMIIYDLVKEKFESDRRDMLMKNWTQAVDYGRLEGKYLDVKRQNNIALSTINELDAQLYEVNHSSFTVNSD